MRFQGYRSLFWFGFQEIPYEGEEVVLVSVAVADPLGHLDLVVEPLQPAGGDVVPCMGHKPIQALLLEPCEPLNGGEPVSFLLKWWI